jgi:polyisoprenoid-binding protein YceI
VSRVRAILPLILLVNGWSHGALAEARHYRLDTASSRVVLHVGKAGLFRFAGHEHEVVAVLREGAASVDPDRVPSSSVELTFDVAALRVTGKGEPPDDVPKVQEAMLGPKCLDAARYPTIRFVSSTVDAKHAAAGALDVLVRGTLTMHGVSRPLTVPVHVVMGDGAITATGTVALRQTDFGITPITVAGVVKVKDEVSLEWHLVGRR